VKQSEPQPAAPAADERKDSGQDPPTRAGVRPDPKPDSNEVADRKASIVEPDGSPSRVARSDDDARSDS
jgi:hypothetical protein